MSARRLASVLVVDDERDMAEMIRFCLSQRGHVVEIADGGARAVELATATPFQLAICDLTMPGLDGVQTARALKTLQPDIPIILVSGYATDAAVSAMRTGVMNAWLSKPFTVDELEETVDRVLLGGPSRAATGPDR